MLTIGVDEQFDVVAQAGQRRAQLVAGILDQPSLFVAGVLQRCEHRVERLG
jgi:hypothetical protein